MSAGERDRDVVTHSGRSSSTSKGVPTAICSKGTDTTAIPSTSIKRFGGSDRVPPWPDVPLTLAGADGAVREVEARELPVERETECSRTDLMSC